MGKVKEGYNHLQSQWHILQQRWQQTDGLWQDSVKERFDRECWAEWEKEVPAAMKAFEELEQVLVQARRSVH